MNFSVSVVDKKLQRIDFKDFLEPEAAPAEGLASGASQGALAVGDGGASLAVASESNTNANSGEAQSAAPLDNQSEVTAPAATESAAPLPGLFRNLFHEIMQDDILPRFIY